MKIIGLIGGMSWESTVSYYKIINEGIKKALGGLHSAECILYSVDFDEIEKYQSNNQWELAGEALSAAAQKLEKAGADFIVICTNTMHKVVPQIQSSIQVPVLHIAEATAAKINESELKKVALLGTKYTMEQDFYKSKIIETGIDIIIPDQHARERINQIIFEELCLGNIREESRRYYLEVIEKLVQEGAEGIILGCTEIGLLIKQEDVKIPLFDTTVIHAEKAVKFALK
ncbi:aspartate/glutamate racemase family protein [Neobacillus sp. D3-1R]|uniref:aspartate/glutamate racemase family protein n=1 Tax=Neobacillus sp. D3-1R TaxID=3445778 RepID=UPI003FA10716